jgi:hypothetical protein
MNPKTSPLFSNNLNPSFFPSPRPILPVYRLWLGLLLAAGLISQVAAQSNMAIYTDSLQNSWNNWSWGSTINFNYHSSSQYIHSGSASMSITMTNGYAGLYLEHADFDSTPYGNLTFWVNGGPSGNQSLAVKATLGGTATANQYNFTPSANTWQQITVPLSTLGVANSANFDGIWIQSQSSSALPVFYVDDMTLLTNGTPPVTNITVAVSVNAQQNRHAISPLIYGVAFANSSSDLLDLNCPIHRSGGNAETRYNWLIDAHNRGADWYFESIGDSPTGTPGADADSFISMSKTGGADPAITIPMIGWACKLGSGRAKLDSFSVAKYGAQTATDPYWSDAGNGISTASGNPYIVNDPNDADFQTNSNFQVGWLQHITNTWGVSTNGGVKYYLMDNEHSIWFSTHRDVHPIGPTMQEIFGDIVTNATLVKSNDPNALVLAPEEWGWGGYFNSGYDQQNSGGHDRAANGGWDYCPWLLNQLHQYDSTNNGIGAGQRSLDYFTLHCYPQEGDVSSSTDVSTTTALLRNQTTRVFWDTNYTDPSWINSVIMLIPRMKSWVAAYYPGTKIGVTEYNWGADGYINGATAQADILGIFGSQGLDLATRWTEPASGTPTYNAMKMYRNYDGNKSTFGDTSVSDTVSTNVDYVSSFAAVRSSDGAMTVMVVNKQLTASAALTINLANFVNTGSAQVWQLTANNVISQLSNINFSGSVLSNTVPAQSITLFVLPPGVVTPPPAPVLTTFAMTSTNTVTFWLTNGVAGLNYVILFSTDLTVPTTNWPSIQTNTLTTSSNSYVFPVLDTVQFYRAMAPWPQ